jgi:fatty aldehyde-generating acyl-ACP reductase
MQTLTGRKKYAFIAYPLSLDLLYKLDPKLKKIDEKKLRELLAEKPPCVASKISGVQSASTKEIIDGEIILVYLLPDQMLTLDPAFVIRRIAEAGLLAQKNGARIIGLGGLTSVIGNQGTMVAKKLDIAVTTGNSYTAAMTIEAAVKAAAIIGIKLEEASVAVIGATGSIGCACAHFFAEKCRHLNIVARNIRRLRELSSDLGKLYKAKVEIYQNVKQSVSNADIVITATSFPLALIDVDDLKSGAVVCDVATPRNVSYQSKTKRKDVLVIDGGLIEPPGKMGTNIDIGLPESTAYACLSETMILAFENRFENYTIGRGLDLKKVKEIKCLGDKHGFKLSEFKSFGEKVSDTDIKKIGILSGRLK